MTNKFSDKTIGYIISTLFIVVGLYMYISNNDDNYVILKKIITKIDSNDGKTCNKSTHIRASNRGINISNNYNCTIYVDNDGSQYPIKIYNSSTSYILGQQIEVYYDKSNPNKTLKLYQKNYWHYFLIIFGLIVLWITHYGTSISNNTTTYSSFYYSDTSPYNPSGTTFSFSY